MLVKNLPTSPSSLTVLRANLADLYRQRSAVEQLIRSLEAYGQLHAAPGSRKGKIIKH